MIHPNKHKSPLSKLTEPDQSRGLSDEGISGEKTRSNKALLSDLNDKTLKKGTDLPFGVVDGFKTVHKN
jgi:hypothetical protein